jgi:hypothetical protein
MSTDDHAVEPIPGLPERPPAGETILWQGRPDWWTTARRVLHVDIVAAWFAAIFLWRLASGVMDGRSFAALLSTLLPMLALALVAIALLLGLARAISATTIYTITSRRVVLRFGMALPVTFNLPFSAIQSAAVRVLGGGHGEISLALMPGQRLAYLVLWPHVRPWRLKSPQPMLRAIADVDAVADRLADALAADTARPVAARSKQPKAVPETALPALVPAE